MSSPSTSSIKPAQAPTKPSISAMVVAKLLFFTFAMFSLPLLTYYKSLDSLFDGNTTYAAGAAAVVANLVVLGYIITAVFEDVEKPKSE